jgi:hypothetical protein
MRGLFICPKMTATFFSETSKNVSQTLHILGNKHFSSVCASLLPTKWKPSKAATDQPSPSPRHFFPSSRPILLYVSERHVFCSYHGKRNSPAAELLQRALFCGENEGTMSLQISHRLSVLLPKYDYTSTMTFDTSFFLTL